MCYLYMFLRGSRLFVQHYDIWFFVPHAHAIPCLVGTNNLYMYMCLGLYMHIHVKGCIYCFALPKMVVVVCMCVVYCVRVTLFTLCL